MPNSKAYVHFTIRSLWFWSTTKIIMPTVIYPLMAYDSLFSKEELVKQCDAQPGLGAVDQDAMRKLAVDLAAVWELSFTRLNIHTLYWSLARFNAAVQQEIANKFINNHPMIMKQDTSDKIPANIMTKLMQDLDSLEAALLAKDDKMPVHLREIHSLLISYPETVHLLDDAEIATLIGAAQQHSKIQIASVEKSKAGRKKISEDDL